MKQILVNIYSFNELPKKSQLKAINHHRNFLQSLPVEIESESGELEEVYGMQYTDSEIVENIEANEYLFYFNGDLCNATTYTGNHIKAGITEIVHKGITHTI